MLTLPSESRRTCTRLSSKGFGVTRLHCSRGLECLLRKTQCTGTSFGDSMAKISTPFSQKAQSFCIFPPATAALKHFLHAFITERSYKQDSHEWIHCPFLLTSLLHGWYFVALFARRWQHPIRGQTEKRCPLLQMSTWMQSASGRCDLGRYSGGFKNSLQSF